MLSLSWKSCDSDGRIRVENFYFLHNSQKCGTVEIRKNSPEVISIWNVKIDEEFRGQKLSHILIKETLTRIRRGFPEVKNVILFVFSNNIPAKKVYEKAGFKYSEKLPDDAFQHSSEIEKMMLILNGE